MSRTVFIIRVNIFRTPTLNTLHHRPRGGEPVTYNWIKSGWQCLDLLWRSWVAHFTPST
jgi:hypothetical protein